MDLSSSPHLLFLLKKKVLPILSHPSTRRTSAPLRIRLCSSAEHQSLSIPLQDSLRFFRLLSLYLPQLALRLACLSRRRHRVTTFHTSDNRCLRPVLSAGGSFARVGDCQRYPTYPLTFLVQAYQFLWLVQYDGSYKRSHMLAIASYPSTSPGGNFQEGFFLTVETPYRSTLAHQ
jgi:hypothetical protein